MERFSHSGIFQTFLTFNHKIQLQCIITFRTVTLENHRAINTQNMRKQVPKVTEPQDLVLNVLIFFFFWVCAKDAVNDQTSLVLLIPDVKMY